MCDTCNHGYPLALSLVTRYRWKTPVVVADQLRGERQKRRSLLMLIFFIKSQPIAETWQKNKQKFFHDDKTMSFQL